MVLRTCINAGRFVVAETTHTGIIFTGVGGGWAAKNIILRSLQVANQAFSSISEYETARQFAVDYVKQGLSSLKGKLANNNGELTPLQTRIKEDIKQVVNSLMPVLRLPENFTYAGAFKQLGVCFAIGFALDLIATVNGYESFLGTMMKKVHAMLGQDPDSSDSNRLKNRLGGLVK